MDKLFFGLNVTAIGMIIVFFGLVILIVCINLLKPRTGNKKEETVKPVPVEQTLPIAVEMVPEESDDTLIAVITAAVAAMLAGDTSQGKNGFVVRHVRRITNSPAWQRAGREEQTYSRL